MNMKELIDIMAEQITRVRSDQVNIPQAETIANLAGKTIKAYQLEMQASAMKARGEAIDVVERILTPTKADQ